jgi:hypothetical protein
VSNQDRLTAAITAAQEAVHEMRFGRVKFAAPLLESALKEIYAIQQDAPPLVSTEGQGR